MNAWVQFCSVSTCQIALNTHDDHPLKPNEYFCPAPLPPSNFQINLIFALAIAHLSKLKLRTSRILIFFFILCIAFHFNILIIFLKFEDWNIVRYLRAPVDSRDAL